MREGLLDDDELPAPDEHAPTTDAIEQHAHERAREHAGRGADAEDEPDRDLAPTERLHVERKQQEERQTQGARQMEAAEIGRAHV